MDIKTGVFSKENAVLFENWLNLNIMKDYISYALDFGHKSYEISGLSNAGVEIVIRASMEFNEMSMDNYQNIVDDHKASQYIEIDNNLFLSSAIEGVSIDNDKQLSIYGNNAHYTILKFKTKSEMMDAYRILWNGIVYDRYVVIGKSFVKRSRVVSTRWDNPEMIVTLKSRSFLKTVANKEQVHDFNEVMKGNSCY